MQKKDAEVKKKAASLCLNDLASIDDPLVDWFTNHVCRFLPAGAAFFPVHFIIIQMWKVSLKIHFEITFAQLQIPHGHLFQLHQSQKTGWLDLVGM